MEAGSEVWGEVNGQIRCSYLRSKRMSSNRSDIIALIVDKVGADEKIIADDTDINRGLGCTGDDFHELMEEFQKKFNVDMSSYRWYFHTEEEGSGGIGSWFFRPPNERVEHIPVTVAVLVQAAETGHWPILYPPHELPKHRWDITINGALFLAVMTWMTVLLLKQCS